MMHPSKTLILAFGLSLGVLSAQEAIPAPVASQPAANLPSIKIDELGKHPFSLSGLSLSIVGFGPGYSLYEARLENATQDPISFSPGALVFVAKDGIQVVNARIGSRIYLGGGGSQNEHYSTYGTFGDQPINVLPGAHLSMFYSLEPSLTTPAKLYYNGKLLAEIIK